MSNNPRGLTTRERRPDERHQRATGILARAMARPVSQNPITFRRSQQSTSAPAGRQNTAKGRPRGAPTRPVCAGENVKARTSNGKVKL